MSVNENIKIQRKKLGISAEVLAEKVGVSPSTIYRFEKGDTHSISTEMLEAIAKALSTTPSHLAEWKESSSEEDYELTEYLEQLKTRPELKMLFSLANGATKEDVEKAVQIVEVLLKDKK